MKFPELVLMKPVERMFDSALDLHGREEKSLLDVLETKVQHKVAEGEEKVDDLDPDIQILFDELSDDDIFYETANNFTLKDVLEGKVALNPPARPSPKPGATRLRVYWTKGKGAAKIQWGIPHDFYRCVAHLGKYVGPRAKGLCANYHKIALGAWPGREFGKDLFTVNDTTNELLIKMMNDDTILTTDANDPEGESQ